MRLSREELLKSLISFSTELSVIRKELSNFPWDSNSSVAVLSAEDLLHLLNRYIEGNITAAQLEEWANIIESREDIEFDMSRHNIIKNIIFWLANPSLTEEIAVDIAHKNCELLRAEK